MQPSAQRFIARVSEAEETALAKILSTCFQPYGGAAHPPYSFILKGLKDFVPFLRQNVKLDIDTRKSMSDFEKNLRDIWKQTLGILTYFS